METWQNGRQELLEELTKTYDRIGAKLSIELDHGGGVWINRDKLQDLRNKASGFDELEIEVSTLTQQKCALDLAHRRNTDEIDKLNKIHSRLVEERKRLMDKASRVVELEKSNQLLNAKVMQLQQTQDTANQLAGGNDSKSISGPTYPTPSARRIEYDESMPVTREAYQCLVSQYNTVYENWADIKVARKYLIEALSAEKEKTKQYKKYCDDLEKVMTKRKEKIQSQDEEIERLKIRMRELDNLSSTSEGVQTNIYKGLWEGQKVQNLEQVARALNFASPGPIHNAGKTVSIPEVARSLNSSAPEGIMAASCQMGNGPFNPVLDECNHHAIEPPAPGSRRAAEGVGSLRRSSQDQSERPTSSDLPVHLAGGESVGPDIESGIPEPHQSSSTDEDTDAVHLETMGYQAIKEESFTDAPASPDTPVVISSRSVKKRKRCNDTSTPKNGSKVKDEIISSSPMGLPELYALNDSIDLDEIGEKQTTPRKGRQLLPILKSGPHPAKLSQVDGSQSQNYSCAGNIVDLHPLLQDTPIHRVGVSRTGFALQPLSSNRKILPRTSEGGAPKRRRIASDKAVEDLVEDGQKIQSLEKSSRKGQPSPHLAKRLDELLAKPSPPKSILSPTRSTRLPNSESSQPRLPAMSDWAYEVPIAVPVFNDADKGMNGRLMGSKKYKRPSSPSPKGTIEEAVEFENPSLRSRPLHQLTLQDFKVNPKYNQGCKYAFTAVVRNQADRRCLQGCTKLECCGSKFRALAEAARDPDKTPTMSQEEADERLLAEFLGDNRYKIRNMTKAERDETLLQARTRELANKHGRHRHAYERRTTPPGFWRVDFPTTQEEIQDREKADQHERELVDQRYHEAMRPGGAYLFRDE